MQTTIQVSGLTKSYSTLHVIRNLDLTVSRGEVFGLLGANGAGKSTAIECMLGTKKADGGSISILGMSPQKDRRKLFQQVGVQFQEANYPDKIRVDELCEETACLYAAPADYRKLLQQFCLREKETNFVSELSGGQRQRLFIVLALIPDPQVVFLDELTTGLDTKARRSVWKSLQELKSRGLTIFLTSHFMDEVEELCDRIGILKNGEFAFCGTAAEAVTLSPGKTLEEAYDMKVIVMEKECFNGREISSTYIRELLTLGNMELVSKLLGYEYPVSGIVQHGKKLGRRLGMPTVNLIPEPGKLLPPCGVYYSDVFSGGNQYCGVTNIGYKPTVDGSFLGVETYLYDFHQDVYGKEATVCLRHYERPEQKFDSVESLKHQMQKDIQLGKQYFNFSG